MILKSNLHGEKKEGCVTEAEHLKKNKIFMP